MKKINFKGIKITDLDGSGLFPDFKAHQTVAHVLKNAIGNKPVRCMELAKKIYDEGEIDLLSEDLLLIKNTIEETTLLSNIVKVPILKALE